VQHFTPLIVVALLALGVGLQLLLCVVFQRLNRVVEAIARRHNLLMPSSRTVAFLVLAVLVSGAIARWSHSCYSDWDDYCGLQEDMAEKPKLAIVPLKEGELDSIERSWKCLRRERAAVLNERLMSMGRVPNVASLIAVANERSIPPYSWWSATSNRDNRKKAMIVQQVLVFFCVYLRDQPIHVSSDQRSLVIYGGGASGVTQDAVILSDSNDGLCTSWHYRRRDIEQSDAAGSQ